MKLYNKLKSKTKIDLDGKVIIYPKTKEVELNVAPLEAYMLMREQLSDNKDIDGLLGEFVDGNFTYTSKLSNGWKIKQLKKKGLR